MPETLFDQLGGEVTLRRIIDRFVDRVFDDVMIGFFFVNARRERIKQKEYEFAANLLGADIGYGGRPIGEAHRAHPIMGGQFLRRLKLLEETLIEFSAPEAVRAYWLAHTESLRPLVTGDGRAECNPERAAERVAQVPNAPLPRRKP